MGERDGEGKGEAETNAWPSLPSEHLICSVAFGGELSSALHPTNGAPPTSPVLGTAAVFKTVIQDGDVQVLGYGPETTGITRRSFHQILSNGSEPLVILTPRGHSEIPGDTFDCHNWEGPTDI